jgi:hypothetical protein
VVSAVAAHAASYPVSGARALAVGVVAAAYGTAVYAAARRLSRSVPVGAAVSIAWSLAVFAYPVLFARVLWMRGWPEPATAAAYLAVIAAICAVLLIRRRFGNEVPAALSLAVAVMLAGMVAQIVPAYVRHPFELPLTPLPAPAAARADRPNIYHLVLDGLGRPDVLQARYHVDLSEPLRSLAASGFVLEQNAVTNYAQTYLSIPSMLNADYLHIPSSGATENSRRPLHDAVQHNAVFAALRRAGYEITFLASDYSATEDNAQATTCQCPPTMFGEFEANVIYRTPFRSLLPGGFDYVPHRNRVEHTLDAFGTAARSGASRPRYVFAHVLSPHPPFIFAADGTFAPPMRAFTVFDGSMYPGTAAEYRAGYAAQAQYLVRRAAAAAASIIREDPGAVIIINGDHGPRLGFSATDARLTDADEVVPIFLAIRWPAGSPAAPPVDSLVNLYRAVLDRALGASLPPLPSRSYISSFTTPYELLEVPAKSAAVR